MRPTHDGDEIVRARLGLQIGRTGFRDGYCWGLHSNNPAAHFHDLHSPYARHFFKPFQPRGGGVRIRRAGGKLYLAHALRHPLQADIPLRCPPRKPRNRARGSASGTAALCVRHSSAWRSTRRACSAIGPLNCRSATSSESRFSSICLRSNASQPATAPTAAHPARPRACEQRQRLVAGSTPRTGPIRQQIEGMQTHCAHDITSRSARPIATANSDECAKRSSTRCAPLQKGSAFKRHDRAAEQSGKHGCGNACAIEQLDIPADINPVHVWIVANQICQRVSRARILRRRITHLVLHAVRADNPGMQSSALYPASDKTFTRINLHTCRIKQRAQRRARFAIDRTQHDVCSGSRFHARLHVLPPGGRNQYLSVAVRARLDRPVDCERAPFDTRQALGLCQHGRFKQAAWITPRHCRNCHLARLRKSRERHSRGQRGRCRQRHCTSQRAQCASRGQP